ncbi:Imm10 family immunity protein [Kosakonia sacchari]|uniref:Imm10 family immunity protein n=1 Tax=Kosakonia sacchari TaxID=1158459 RepID=UPI00158517CF|nr:Imm10 family immunity protein [Kosakonia sacchari]NUL38303.1 hypothetical protein [Kosakonia sacchari]
MSKIREFIAVCVNCYKEDDVLTIGIGDDAHDPKNFIIIGRFDEEDLPVNECIGFQSDTTEYEISDAIQSVKLGADKLAIVLNNDAAIKADTKEYHVIILITKDTELLRKYLQEVFEGSEITLQLF